MITEEQRGRPTGKAQNEKIHHARRNAAAHDKPFDRLKGQPNPFPVRLIRHTLQRIPRL